MTQKSLISRCYLWSGKCTDCPNTDVCDKYKLKFQRDPYEDDEFHPERYVEEELE